MGEYVFNCHTHIGDAFISSDVIGNKKWTVEELVAPPLGLKHRMLNEASDETIAEGMKKAISIMKGCGTTHFCDFREGGAEGAEQLKRIAEGEGINAMVLGRPVGLSYDRVEMDKILEIADGIGVSSISDWDYDELRKVAEHTRKRKKMFALHASEAVREDINAILDLKPSFLVHMSSASIDDIEIVADEGMPIVVCPRSNAFFGIRPDIEGMLSHGIPLMLGTDNAMIVPPDITGEIRYLIDNFDVSREQAADMITSNPRKYLNVSPDIQQSDISDI